VSVRVALLGHPVEHSRSPAMQNAAFEAAGLDWRYEAIDVGPDRFESEVRRLARERFAGANVTVPHKLRALEVADRASEVARSVGAANTLELVDGEVRAHNTDVEGFLRALRERAPEAPAGIDALVLGAGGAGRAVVYALLEARAARVGVWNRHRERAERLVGELAPRRRQAALEVVSDPTHARAELLVNATSVGMPLAGRQATPEDCFKLLHLPADKFRDVQIVVDLVYADEGTALVREAEARGVTYVDGFDILVHQGAASFELWTGRPAPLEVMRIGARKQQIAGDL
jgi:shikimate dehydrogenase